jgi:hypothetical protein
MIYRIAIVSLAALTLGGCAIFGGPADRALRRTPSYRAGYDDGCAAVSGPSANPRDTAGPLTDEDRAYRRGYAGGLMACRPTTVAPGDAPHRSPTGGIQVPGG